MGISFRRISFAETKELKAQFIEDGLLRRPALGITFRNYLPYRLAGQPIRH